MLKINQEDMAQAALTIKKYCEKNEVINTSFECKCPWQENGQCRLFAKEEDSIISGVPKFWKLEEFLRARGTKCKLHESIGDTWTLKA